MVSEFSQDYGNAGQQQLLGRGFKCQDTDTNYTKIKQHQSALFYLISIFMKAK